MATTSKDIKRFYRQKKKTVTGGISKSKSSLTRKPSAKHVSAIGSDVSQPAALISHGSDDLQDDYDDKEELLRQFDMNMAYGPCLGMSRLARWERAQRLGMSPPKQIEKLLKGGKLQQECLWDGCV